MASETRVLHRWRSRVQLLARNRVRMPARNRLRTCARSRVRLNERSRVRVSARKMWSCTNDLRRWSIGSEDYNAMRRQSVCLLSCLHVVETPHVLKQGVYKLHCWFTEPDATLLLTCELFLLPSRKLVDLTRLYLGGVRSLWWFSWFVFEKSCCVVKLHGRRQFLGGSVRFFWYI